MEELRELIGVGLSALVYKIIGSDIALKVYYRNLTELPEREYENMTRARERGINVPKPRGLTKIELREDDLDKVPKWFKFINRRFDPSKISDLLGKESSVLKMEYIQGEDLTRRLLPSIKLKRKMDEFYRRIREAGLIYADPKLEHHILTPDDELRIVDCEQLVPEEEKALSFASQFLARHPPTSQLGWLPFRFYYAIGGF